MVDTPIANFTDGATAVATDRIAAARSPFAVGDDRYLTPAYIKDYILGLANSWTAQNTFAAGTITTSQPLTLTQTWNAAGVSFTGLLANITNTASAAASLLMDLQIGGVSQFAWSKSGVALIGTTTSVNNTRLNNKFAIVHASNNTYVGMSVTGYSGANTDPAPFIDLQRSRGTTDGTMTAVTSGDSLGFIIGRGADGTNFCDAASIRFEVDGTVAGSSVPGVIKFRTTAVGQSFPTDAIRINNAQLTLIGPVTGTFSAASGAPTGTQINEHWIRTNNPFASVCLQVLDSAGYPGLRVVDDNGYEHCAFAWGNSASDTRFRGFAFWEASTNTGYSATPPPFALIQTVIDAGTSTHVLMTVPADGVLALFNQAQTSFDRLQFGGTTSSFPSLKRSSTILQARLADDSAFAPLQGLLRSNANATAEVVVASHTLRIFDAAGTEYRVLAIPV